MADTSLILLNALKRGLHLQTLLTPDRGDPLGHEIHRFVQRRDAGPTRA